tara:strand:+ start:3522 stop:5534 length:2013 start_codon:yes stop_codon:yes gene_type:complete
MANIIQLKRGTGASSSATEPAEGEPVFDTGTGKLYISTDGSTALSAMTAINAGTASSLAADNLTAGDAAVTISTSSGNITLDAAANDSDIILKGTDGGADVTFLTIDGSAAGAATFNDKITAVGTSVFTNLDISGDVDVDGTLETDALTIGGTALTSVCAPVAGHASIATVGALNAGSITSGFGNIDTGSSTVTTTGLGTFGSLDVDNVLINGTTIGHTDDTDLMTLADGVLTVAGELDAASLDISGNADIDGTLEADAITVNGTALAELVSDTVGAMFSSNTETRITATYQDSDNTIDLVVDDMTANDNDDVSVANLKTALAGGFGSNAVTIGDSNDVVTVGNDLVVTGDLTVSGDTTTLNVATLAVEDKNITLNKGGGDTSGSADGAGITIQDAVNASTDATMNWNAANDKFVFSHLIEAPGTSIFTNLDVSGDVDVDGTLEADAITVGGTALNTVIAGVTSTNATTAAVATTVTITDNESTNENNPIVFVAGGDLDGGNLGLESDGTTTYNPSTGKITATGFVGALTGDVTGDVSGSSGSCTGQAATVATIAGLAPNTATTQGTQAAITSCANLVTVGTIGTGIWQGTAIASAYLDADTAHLTTTQTFSGAKTFTANATFGANDTGVDVIFYGATASKNMTWDESADNLVFAGGASIDGLTLDGGSF